MKYEVVNKKDNVEIQLSDSFTFRDSDAFFKVLDMMKKGYSHKTVVFNFSKCNFIDSAALGLLVITHDVADENEIRLVVKGAKDKVRQTMFAARFDTFFDIKD